VATAERDSLRSGELARLAGVSKDTLRHYERIGVLMPPQRNDSGYRLHSATALRRVFVIRAALDIGIGLKDLQEIFALRESGQRPCKDVRKLANKRLDVVLSQIEALAQLRDRLSGLLRDWDERLAGGSEKELVYLLETLVPEHTNDKGNTP
jgi:DNA-binding transcriptional MerR regulator